MSVTFCCPNSGFKTIPCTHCESARHSGYIKHDETCIPGCDGLERVYNAPECNFANGNARAVLETLGYHSEDDLYGSVKHEDLPGFIAKLIRAINSTATVRGLVRPTEEYKGARGCNVIECGTDADRVVERFNQILVLAKWAQENGHDISWG